MAQYHQPIQGGHQPQHQGYPQGQGYAPQGYAPEAMQGQGYAPQTHPATAPYANYDYPSQHVQQPVHAQPGYMQQTTDPEGTPLHAISYYLQGPGITVKQTMKGCFKECLGCEDTSEYRISDWTGIDAAGSGTSAQPQNQFPYKLYALEESDAFCRCCICNCFGCTSGRELELNVSVYNNSDPKMEGSKPRGRPPQGTRPLLTYKKPASCPVCIRIPTEDGMIPIPCCCNLPELETYSTHDNRFLGRSEYICDGYCCVPKWHVYNQNNQLSFFVRPDTCCAGCCIQCRCDGKGGGCIYEPMLIRNPQTKDPIMTSIGQPAAVTKVWSGLKKECCSEADNFAVTWPDGIDTAMKANILGLTFLVDYTFYEGNEA